MTRKRAIFEEVGSDAKAAEAPAGGMIDAGRRGARGAVRIWLMALFALVVVMIAVGGLTRLTDSGLSITEWRPVTGALPPMDAAAWEAEFEKYRAIPEYQLQNKGMSLAEFKVIYWWEWGHRQLGRVIGLVWAIGLVGFAATRSIPKGWAGRLFLVGALGGLQGAVGWWMVSSGLEGSRLDVASYRLATHLGLAFVILGLIAWYVFQLGREERLLMQARRGREARLFGLAGALAGLTFLQILLGALVAGIDAGRNYVDWPLMAGGILPPDLFALEPLWRNFFEDDGLVQFMHRSAGYVLFLFGVAVWWMARRSGNARVRFGFNAVLAVLFLQMTLGVVTVMQSAPWHLAILHQAGAVLLWVLVLRARFLAGYPPPQSIRGAT
jgi:cytochrome c oxidase assembly protein subunit 15